MTITKRLLPALFLILGTVFYSGCEDDGGGGSGDIGDNDPNLVVCMGDSITRGGFRGGSGFTDILASMSGKTVLNYGAGGAESNIGAASIHSALAKKPGYVCIMYGANDAINNYDPQTTKGAILSMISACKANKSIPIVGTTPPMIDGHERFNGKVKELNEAIKSAASEGGARCVDVYSAFGNGEGLFVHDGLHPNAAGAAKIAKCFNSAL